MRSLASHCKTIAAAFLTATALTYASLIVPRSASVVCADMSRPIECPVLAYGFPLPFLVDSQAISPVGSVARDPLSLLIGLDEVSWPRLALTGGFWMLATLAGRLAWLRRQCRPDNH